jgi:alpha-beta hydrolase superfamily lysophospholipase
VDRPVRGFVALAPAFRPHTLRRIRELVVGALVAPARTLGSYRWQMDARRAIRETATRIPEVRCPLLVLHSCDDPTVSPRGGRELYERASSVEKRFVELQGQGHVLSCAPDLASVAGPIREFLAAR